MPVLVAQASITNVPVQIDPPPVGHVAPMQSVNVRAQVDGIINDVHFQEGQEVKKGELLFTLDPRPAQAALTLAGANLQRDEAQQANAQIQFARDQKLFDQHLISQDAFDTSKAALDALTGTVAADRAAVTNAELNLQYTEIRSPIDGRTGSMQFHAGNVVKSPDDVLLTINQIHPIYVLFAVPEQFLPEIKREMRDRTLEVSVTYQNMTRPTPRGELTFVDNAVDETTGTILLKATFPNQDGALWPGQFVNVTLTLSELTNAVVVPSQSVQTGQNGQFIYVVVSNPTNATLQTVEERPVKTGITFEGETVIQNGIRTGETVVTDGQLRLAAGVSVNIKSPPPAASANSSTSAP